MSQKFLDENGLTFYNNKLENWLKPFIPIKTSQNAFEHLVPTEAINHYATLDRLDLAPNSLKSNKNLLNPSELKIYCDDVRITHNVNSDGSISFTVLPRNVIVDGALDHVTTYAYIPVDLLDYTTVHGKYKLSVITNDPITILPTMTETAYTIEAHLSYGEVTADIEAYRNFNCKIMLQCIETYEDDTYIMEVETVSEGIFEPYSTWSYLTKVESLDISDNVIDSLVLPDEVLDLSRVYSLPEVKPDFVYSQLGNFLEWKNDDVWFVATQDMFEALETPRYFNVTKYFKDQNKLEVVPGGKIRFISNTGIKIPVTGTIIYYAHDNTTNNDYIVKQVGLNNQISNDRFDNIIQDYIGDVNSKTLFKNCTIESIFNNDVDNYALVTLIPEFTLSDYTGEISNFKYLRVCSNQGRADIVAIDYISADDVMNRLIYKTSRSVSTWLADNNVNRITEAQIIYNPISLNPKEECYYISEFSHVEGNNNFIVGNGVHAEGTQNVAVGNSTHIEGRANIVNGNFGHAEGVRNRASYGGHAEGGYTQALSSFSHSEGYETKASANESHAEGYGSQATAIASHAEGDHTLSKGKASHSEGINTLAKGKASHVEGEGTIAHYDYQHVEGKYNDTLGVEVLHAIGNGTSEKKKTIHTVDIDGNARYAGDIYVHTTNFSSDNGGYVNGIKVATVEETNSLSDRIGTVENTTVKKLGVSELLNESANLLRDTKNNGVSNDTVYYYPIGNNTTQGYIATDGSISTASSYKYNTDRIPIYKGDKVSCVSVAANGGTTLISMRFICVYNIFGEVISYNATSGVNTNTKAYVVDDPNAAYVVITVAKGSSWTKVEVEHSAHCTSSIKDTNNNYYKQEIRSSLPSNPDEFTVYYIV